MTILKTDGNEGFIHDKQERIKARDAWASNLYEYFGDSKAYLFTLTVEDRFDAVPSPYWTEVQWFKVVTKYQSDGYFAKIVAFLEVSKEGRPHIHGAVSPTSRVLEFRAVPEFTYHTVSRLVKLVMAEQWSFGHIDIKEVNSKLMTFRYIAKDNRLLTKWSSDAEPIR